MKYKPLVLFFTIGFIELFAQPNCELLKEDKACYQGCNTAWQAIRYKQGSYKSQKLFDKSIKLCPSFAYSYQQKAVAHLKRGQFIEWKKLIDIAVKLSPIEYLGYRGWCRIQFLRDYKGAINDIEELKSLISDIGFCQNGTYHLEIALGLCYKEIGQLEKAKEIFNSYMNSKFYSEALYNYYHLGVIEFELGNIEAAKIKFNQQREINEISECHFYLAKIAKLSKNAELHLVHINKAKELYENGSSLNDNYTEPIDKIYLLDILEEKYTEANNR